MHAIYSVQKCFCMPISRTRRPHCSIGNARSLAQTSFILQEQRGWGNEIQWWGNENNMYYMILQPLGTYVYNTGTCICHVCVE